MGPKGVGQTQIICQRLHCVPRHNQCADIWWCIICITYWILCCWHVSERCSLRLWWIHWVGCILSQSRFLLFSATGLGKHGIPCFLQGALENMLLCNCRPHWTENLQLVGHCILGCSPIPRPTNINVTTCQIHNNGDVGSRFIMDSKLSKYSLGSTFINGEVHRWHSKNKELCIKYSIMCRQSFPCNSH